MSDPDWDAYFWPGITVLRNKLGITDPDELRAVEYRMAAARQTQLGVGAVTIEPTFDADHLSAVHHHLFQDLYDWAGQWRTVGMSKGMSVFAHPNQIGDYLTYAHGLATAALEHSPLTPDMFADRGAAVYAAICQGHPFREGNGRAGKVVMQQFAHEAGYHLDYARVSKAQWDNASMLSGPDRGQFPPVPDSLVPVFKRIAEPDTPRTKAIADALDAARTARRGQRPYRAEDARRPRDHTERDPRAATDRPDRGYGR